ncbi:MAG: HAMP domain-containing sensor histidine kinase [bacterium]
MFRSFAFYLGMGYLIVYALCTGGIFFLSSRVITKSARGFDRQDVRAAGEELSEMLEQNKEGNWLAEEITLKRYPPSTIVIVRVLNAQGKIEYAVTKPKDIDIPMWRAHTPQNPVARPPVGWSEYYLKSLRRHIQVQTLRLNDGRTLQVGKGSFLEYDQKTMMSHTLLLFMGLSTLFSFVSSVFMLFITLRPIHRITESMNHIIETHAFEKGAPPVTSAIAELDTLGRLFTVMTGKYASLIQAMRETLDNIAHDFRTPLARIRSASEFALNDKPLPEGLANTLADIIEDCDRAQLQLQNIMDVREMESGFVQLNIQPFSLTQLIGEIVDLYSLLAEEKQIALSARFPEQEILIEGDKHRIARALANLVDNAVKYTPKGGRVTLTFDIQPEMVVLCVTDTGIGIPEAEQGLIWQRLFRGRQARESEKGLGLGLNIVQIIITAHGGTVTLTSTPGQGSTFCVTLPKTAKTGVG